MNYLFILSFSLLVSSRPNELLSVSLLLLPAQEANIATLIKQMKAKKTSVVYNLYAIQTIISVERHLSIDGGKSCPKFN